MKMLLVEDEYGTCLILRDALTSKAFKIDIATSGHEAIERALAYEYSVMALDLYLPDMPGLEVARHVRRHKPSMPIIVISGEDRIEAKLELLALCDDYLCKPFLLDEFVARIDALTRRGPALHIDVLHIGDLELDVRACTARRGSKWIDLRSKELTLLEFLMRNQGIVLSRSELLEGVWGLNVDPFTNTVDVHVRRLRKKIDDGFEQKLLHTIPGRGYRLSDRPHKV